MVCVRGYTTRPDPRAVSTNAGPPGDNPGVTFTADWVLSLFHDSAEKVPAYGAFLDEHGVLPDEIRTLRDFERLPLVTKENVDDKAFWGNL